MVETVAYVALSLAVVMVILIFAVLTAKYSKD